MKTKNNGLGFTCYFSLLVFPQLKHVFFVLLSNKKMVVKTVRVENICCFLFLNQ